MAYQRISQKEVRRLRARVAILERAEEKRRSNWWQEFFGGVEIGRMTFSDTCTIPEIVRTARKLEHAVVAVGDDSKTMRFVALPLGRQERT